VCHIPDITSSRHPNPEVFSDGVGRITSAGMLKAIRRHGAFRRGATQLPSALQVRFGGAKGVLTRWDVRLSTSAALTW
jgi:RNA-dependent RNA polymerase